MSDVLRYIFAPNPGHADYGDPWVVAAIAALAALIAGSLFLRFWRARIVTNAVTRKLSRTWNAAAFWFGITGLVLVVSRVEKIQFIGMRFLWVVWAAFLLLYVVFQFRVFRARHYEVLPTVRTADPRAKYLPKAKK